MGVNGRKQGSEKVQNKKTPVQSKESAAQDKIPSSCAIYHNYR